MKKQEQQKEKKINRNRNRNRNNDLFEDTSSTYRIFSRLYCNFVMPEPKIKRPLPNVTIQNTIKNKKFDEDLVDAKTEEEIKENVDGKHDVDEMIKEVRQDSNNDYRDKINNVLKELEENKEEYLIGDNLSI